MKTPDEKIYQQSINDLRTPDAPDLRLYRLIPYTGKLNKLTGDIKLPFTTISVTSATKSKKIQLVISYDTKQRCAYINSANYKKYRFQVDAWFITSNVSSIQRRETANVINSSLETEGNDRNTTSTEKTIVNPSTKADKSESPQSVQKTLPKDKEKVPLHAVRIPKTASLPLHCIRDNSILTLIDQKMVKIGNKKSAPVIFPRYYCPKCMRLYTSIPKYLDSTKIRFLDKRYTNIHPDNDRLRYAQFLRNPHPLEAGSKCFVYYPNL